MASPSSLLFLALITFLFLSTVNSQVQDIVSVKTIQDRGSFTITCDINRLEFPPEDSAVTSIFDLYVEINTTKHPANPDMIPVAEYHPLYPGQKEFPKIPNGRTWNVEFSGGNNGTNNKNTIKIEVLVREATCADAGIYQCKVGYANANGFKTWSRSQNVTAKAATTVPVLTLDPIHSGPSGEQNYSTYELNENLTISCRVDGPQNLALKWKRERRPLTGIGITFEDYPYKNDISSDPTTPIGSGICSQYTFKSYLKFSVSEDDKDRKYFCIVQVDDVDKENGSVGIDVIITTPSPAPASDDGPSKSGIGLIVGVVVGCGAGLIIIIIIVVCCVCYRRKSKKNNYNEDRPDGGTESAYPPATYAVSTRTSNDRGSKISTGKTNQALDISFDSTAKGPPVYTIAKDNEPSRQKVTNKSRNNNNYGDNDVSFDRRPPEVAPKPSNDGGPQVRRNSTDDGTDVYQFDYGYQNIGTNV